MSKVTVSLIYLVKVQSLSRVQERSCLRQINRILRQPSNAFFRVNSLSFYNHKNSSYFGHKNNIVLDVIFILDCLLCGQAVHQKLPGYCLETYSLLVRFPFQIGQLPCQFQARWSIGDRKRGYEKTEMTKEMNQNRRD